MSQMSIAPAADHFGSHRDREQAAIAVQRDVVFGDWLPKTRPAGSRIELGRCIKQWLPAADALIDARFLRIPVRAREGPFGALLAGNMELLRRQSLPPFSIGFLDFAVHGNTLPLRQRIG